MRVIAYSFSVVVLALVSWTGSAAVFSAEARCKNCRKAPVVRRTVRHTRSVSRPVRTVVRRTSSYRTKRVRYIRTVKIETHIIPTYRIKKVRTVYLRKVVSYDRRKFGATSKKLRSVHRKRGRKLSVKKYRNLRAHLAHKKARKDALVWPGEKRRQR